jgi:hypothetical protein
MMQNLDQLTTRELKQYLSEHRNDEPAFRAALQVLMSRRDPNAPRQPYPFDLDDPQHQVEAILREKLNQKPNQSE